MNKKRKPQPEERTITVASGVSMFDGKPFVSVWTGEEFEPMQFHPGKAVQIASEIMTAAEASIHDACVVKYLQEKLNLSLEEAGAVLGDFRQYRDTWSPE